MHIMFPCTLYIDVKTFYYKPYVHYLSAFTDMRERMSVCVSQNFINNIKNANSRLKFEFSV